MSTLIGSGPHQAPTNGSLGGAAYFDVPQLLMLANSPMANFAASGVMDCAAANYFTLSVAGATTLSFSNIPAGAYSCVLEMVYTSGAVTMPAGTVWSGSAPTLAAGRWLLFFQRAQSGTAGWLASALGAYTS